MLKNFDELFQQARTKGKVRLVVAGAADLEVLTAIKDAIDLEMVKPILVGQQDKIIQQAGQLGLQVKEVEIINQADSQRACLQAVELVSQGAGDILMKGFVDTSLFMKSVLNREMGLRTDNLLSHIAMVEAAQLGRIVFITDGGINIKPGLEEKGAIIQNAINVARKLGWTNPRVAILAAVEKVNPDMPETIEAAVLSKMANRGQIRGGIVDGPLALDNALSKEAARAKGIDSPVAGQADILLTPDIVSGNILGKTSIYLAGNQVATIVGGTTHPVVLPSRASQSRLRLISLAAAMLMV